MSKDAYWFKHDANALSDLKIEALVLRYGMAGYGMFWAIIETLREAECYQLPRKSYVWSALAKKMLATPEQVEEFVTACIDEFELFSDGDGYFYSPSLMRRMDKWDEIKGKRAEAGRQGGIAKAANAKQNEANAKQSLARRGEEMIGEEKILLERDAVFDTLRNIVSGLLPSTAWPNASDQDAALHRIAKMIRDTQPSTPIDSPEEFARLSMQTYSALKRAGKSDYWKNASFEPIAIERRFGDVVTEMAKRYQQDENEQRGVDALRRMGKL